MTLEASDIAEPFALAPRDARERLLLAEQEHRSANALMAVSSMLRRELSSVASPAAAHVLRKAETQLQAFVLLNKLLGSRVLVGGEAGTVCAGDYLLDVAGYLQTGCFLHQSVTVNTQVDRPSLVAEATARHMGLIVTELAFNSAKHAFTGRSSGSVNICLARIGESALRLVVADDGVGFGPERATGVGGLALVRLLAKSINASCEGRSGPWGTELRITIPSTGGFS